MGTTSETLHPESFLRAIFTSGADLRASIEFSAGSNLMEAFQRPWDVEERIKRALRDFGSYAAIAGIGQYSCTQRGKYGLIARANVYMREAEPEEIFLDLDTLGEQVVGPEISTLPSGQKYTPIYRKGHFGDGCVYTGGPRWEKSIFATKIFQGDVPDDINQIVREVDSISETGEMIRALGYHVFTAERGILRYTAFAAIADFSHRKLQPHGVVEIEPCGHRMNYLPDGSSGERVDFTSFLMRDAA